MYKNIKIFICYSFALVTISLYAYAQVENSKDAAVEQNVSALSNDDEQSSRNPFQPYVPPEEESAQEIYVAGGEGSGGLSEGQQGTSENKFDYSSLHVTGSVWGNDMPKAIINDQVMGIGEVVNEAKILNITKDGILFDYKDKQYLMKREGLPGKQGG